MTKKILRGSFKPAHLFLLLALSVFTAARAQEGAIMHAETEANNSKSNQSRVWFFDGKWWAIAMHEPSNAEYIWRYDGAGVWTRTSTKLEKGSQNRYDAIMDSSSSELAILRSHTTQTKFSRYSYSAGNWVKIISISIANFGNSDNANPLSMAKAKNGDFWVFRVDSSKVQAKKSIDAGATWSSIINIKSGLNTEKGTTDAVVFSSGGIDIGEGAISVTENYVGVAYGEVGAAGINTVFGFLYHRDGDADHIWTDETSSLTYFGTEKGNNALSMTVDEENNIYLFTRSFDGGNGDPRNMLYKRSGVNTWAGHLVNTVSGFNWNSPAVAIEATNGLLIVSGLRTDSSFAEYKSVALGDESLLNSAARNLLMQDGAEVFEHVSLPQHHLNAIDGLLVTAGNLTENSTWFNLVFPAPPVPIIVDTVLVVSNEVNAPGRYTIPIVLTDTTNGTLAAGTGKIFIRFPGTTLVPASIAPGLVTVNGVNAAAVVSDPVLLEVTITTPIILPGGTEVTVVIDSFAAVINPKKIGFDSLQAWTSKQQTQVYSPPYELVRATTKVTPALVTVLPTAPSSPATYTIGFHLGAHGRMCAEMDTINVCFDSTTTVTEGPLTGVTMNSIAATATGASGMHSVHIVVPAGLNLFNNDSVTVFLPNTAIVNPDTAGFYTLFVSTSVETLKVASLPYQIVPPCGSPIAGTFENFSKGNQSKTFYHDGFWWLLAPKSTDKKWHLWKFDGFNWAQGILVSGAPKDRPDAWLESASNKLYVLLPGTTTTKLTRLTYSGGSWSIDSGYPKNVNTVQLDVMNLARANNGHLWVFWIADSTLRAQRSGDEGSTWSAVINIKSHLHERKGLTDAVPFQASGADAIGVGYGEDSGVPGAIFGFLYHKDSDADNVWTDETSKLAPFTGTTADDHVAMMMHNNEIFIVIKTKGGGPSVSKNALYHRKTNGAWTRYGINKNNGWTRPVVAVDVTNNVLCVLGTREGASRNVEMKRVNLGSYSGLQTALIDTLMCDPVESFFDVTMPPHTITSAMGLMAVANNETENDLWFRLVPLGALPKDAGDFEEEQEAQVAGVIDDFKLTAEIYPNPFNPRTTIRFRLHEATPVKLQIFNLSGQLVRTLVDGELAAGVHLRHWNARNHNGENVATGVYIYRLQAGNRLATGQMQLLK